MPIVPLSALARDVAPGRRLLGLDFGTKTIGVALSDPAATVASPRGAIKRTRLAADLEMLRALIEAEDVGGAVLGLPIGMDGREGPACQRVRQFAHDLLRLVNVPLALWDERLSTAAVERMMIEAADLSRRRRAELIDPAAAAYILQGALDAIGHARNRP
jgi:putative Holliday junction resolvase